MQLVGAFARFAAGGAVSAEGSIPGADAAAGAGSAFEACSCDMIDAVQNKQAV